MAGLFDKARDALDSDQGERTSDSLLDTAAAAADRATGGKHGEHIAKARDAADEHIGKRDPDRGTTTDPTASSDRM